MNTDIIDILSQSNKDPDNQKLMDYLSGKLSGEERQELEKLISDNPFMNDALEGLENISDKKNLQAYVDQLNQALHQQLEIRKMNRERKKIQQYPWIYFAIILVLLICIMGFLIIRQWLH
ncbi:MAG: hypothetical protein ACHQET_09595 [Chitinophagales bacterium]